MNVFKYSVVVSINNEVWGTWTVKNKLTAIEELKLQKLIKNTLKDSSFPEYESNVEVIQNLEADSFSELTEEIKEYLHNEFYADSD